jgi:hypothetical protein
MIKRYDIRPRRRKGAESDSSDEPGGNGTDG